LAALLAIGAFVSEPALLQQLNVHRRVSAGLERSMTRAPV
jgi:hypothetical protein